LYAAVCYDCFFNRIYAFLVTIQTLIENTCHRSAGIAANFLSGFNTAFFQGCTNFFQKFTGVCGGQIQVNDPFDTNSQPDNHHKKNRGHPCYATLNKLFLKYIMQLGKTASRSFLCKQSGCIK
jgi:hypothetical protein